ncbi:hypothetical protein BU14_0207s0033 [Porphyra umbilicalis]|uniref:Viral late gene transcription factor 3 zinc ribbon domain-containing protein n=1 Tax=Porphyra umbilicalis TaxID=2786 RepID=A0A1X6P5U6_PORUM|nr:hypothetical protein BU14_0207s0033 [Porphyra umbilicalis]|eukprot:OSX76115.1 hypothetical protein BU14_0207s0033 [Porphyra umbilicalis]
MSVPAEAFAAPPAVSAALTGRPRTLQQQRSRAATSLSALRASTFVVAPWRRQPRPTATAAAHRPRWTAVVNDVGPTAEVIIGSIALCVPFVVASVLFGERIVRQRRCPTCEGSGLVQKGRFMRRCRTCGGFLPWQSWRQFFGLPPKKV